MRGLFSTARDALRAQLWPLPTAAVLLAVLAGYLVPALDAQVDTAMPSWLDSVIFSGDAGAASTVLDAIASSLITVTSLTFSLTVVTLQLASSQFSPRLLRTFTSDLFVQATLAVFLATFSFSITVLRGVRSSGDSSSLFVPRLAVTLAFVLAIGSVFGLVLFLAHLTSQIRVETMLRNVHAEASSTVASVLEKRSAEDPDTEVVAVLPEPATGAVELVACTSGFLTWIELGPLRRCAEKHGAVLALGAHPGSFLVDRVPIARAWPSAGGALSQEAREALQTALDQNVHTGYERTAGQDVGFGLRQLTDVANKALSPGINDPTTAVHALGHISSLLCDLADRRLGPIQQRDEDGMVRLVLQRPDFAELVEVAITQPRRYGAGDPQVLAQLARLLGDLAVRVPGEHRRVVVEQLHRLEETMKAQDFDETEQAFLADLVDKVDRALDRSAHDGAIEHRES